MKDHLTDPQYWAARQTGTVRPAMALTDARESEWLEPVLHVLRPYAGRRFLELGCSPGHASALIRSRLPLRMEGVDTSPSAEDYLANLAAVGDAEASLHQSDLRTFAPLAPYDVVASFGLVEHFVGTEDILDHHLRLVGPGGMVLVVMPSFRGLTWCFHAVFDGEDLARHHLPAMDTDRLRRWAEARGLEVLHAGPCGRMRLWWTHDPASPGRMWWASRVARLLSLAGRWLPVSRWNAPWLILAARRPLP
jgi:SAM-dependent methyltransferase